MMNLRQVDLMMKLVVTPTDNETDNAQDNEPSNESDKLM